MKITDNIMEYYIACNIIGIRMIILQRQWHFEVTTAFLNYNMFLQYKLGRFVILQIMCFNRV